MKSTDQTIEVEIQPHPTTGKDISVLVSGGTPVGTDDGFVDFIMKPELADNVSPEI
jgi:hypothetical protein